MRRTLIPLAAGLLALFPALAAPGRGQALDSAAGPLRVETVAEGLDMPWSFAFLPDGSLLVTELAGRLLHLKDGRATAVRGLPAVEEDGQGGLLDVMVPRDFATTREVYLSFAKAQGSGAGTALGRGRLGADGTRLEGFEVIFEMAPGSRGGRHFGSRIVEAPDGTLFLTIGERGDAALAQDLSRHNGKIVRLNRDGSIPADNPFVGQPGAQPAVWSYGHRNPQGAALDLRGQLWAVEHGAQGGDEVNRIRKGANYGWPVISYGKDYSGRKIGEGTAKPGLEQPAHYWDPSIAPSGMVVYSGRLWPDWTGDILVGSLKFDLVSRLDGASLDEVERIAGPETIRVRDLREGPDGALWILSEGNGALYRVTPASD